MSGLLVISFLWRLGWRIITQIGNLVSFYCVPGTVLTIEPSRQPQVGRLRIFTL